MRTNASMAVRQIGHDRNECPQGTHVARCPHGIHASLFSSSRQRTHKFDDPESSAGALTGIFGFSALLSFLSSVLADAGSGYPSTTTESDDVDISTSVVPDEFVIDDVDVSCGRARVAIKSRRVNNLLHTNSMLLPASKASRISFIFTLGTIIFSFLPSIHSICF